MHCGEQIGRVIVGAGITISPKKKHSLFLVSYRVMCVPRECDPSRTVGRDQLLQLPLLTEDGLTPGFYIVIKSQDVIDRYEQAFERRVRLS